MVPPACGLLLYGFLCVFPRRRACCRRHIDAPTHSHRGLCFFRTHPGGCCLQRGSHVSSFPPYPFHHTLNGFFRVTPLDQRMHSTSNSCICLHKSSSPIVLSMLHQLLCMPRLLWFITKGYVNDPRNSEYRCINLLSHSYKVLSVIKMERMDKECAKFSSALLTYEHADA